jgi:hypothetical protein
MGEAELVPDKKILIIHAVLFFYGDASNETLCFQIARDIAFYWNEPELAILIKKNWYNVKFSIEAVWNKLLTPEEVYENTNPRNNYFRIEEFSDQHISFVDGIGCNTGYFKLDNLLNNSTTAAHEFGHSMGLYHPFDLDIRGKGTPGIMYPRGTIVDSNFQYDPAAAPASKGGTLNPLFRKVLQKDLNDLGLHLLSFHQNNKAIVGDFSSIWHDKHLP